MHLCMKDEQIGQKIVVLTPADMASIITNKNFLL
jgi:hypothetical protein